MYPKELKTQMVNNGYGEETEDIDVCLDTASSTIEAVVEYIKVTSPKDRLAIDYLTAAARRIDEIRKEFGTPSEDDEEDEEEDEEDEEEDEDS